MQRLTPWVVSVFCVAVTACGGTSSTSEGGRDAASDAIAHDVTTDLVVVDVRDAGDESVDVADAGTDTAVMHLPIGPDGGTVDRLRFAVFGDVRPPIPDQVSAYPTMIITSVMDGIEAEHAQFVVGTGDYMNENFCASCAVDQIHLLQMAETHYSGYVFHSMGNHECLTVTSINCPNENESVALRTFKISLIPTRTNAYYDWWIHTDSGDAHFVATAPNAWNDTQRTWLTTVLTAPARYTFVIAHEPPSDPGPGTVDIENAITARTGGVTLRLYGHVHKYDHPLPNAIVTGNAGAPLSGFDTYGFALIEQRADDNIVVTSYAIGTPPTPIDSFVLTPDGMITH